MATGAYILRSHRTVTNGETVVNWLAHSRASETPALRGAVPLTGWVAPGSLFVARGAGTLIPSAQRLVWAAKQPLGNAALGALFA